MASSNWKALATKLKSVPKVGFKRKLDQGAESKGGKPQPANKKRKDAAGEPQKVQAKVDLDDLWFDDVNQEDIRAAYGLSGDSAKAGKAGNKAGDQPVSESAASKWVSRASFPLSPPFNPEIPAEWGNSSRWTAKWSAWARTEADRCWPA